MKAVRVGGFGYFLSVEKVLEKYRCGFIKFYPVLRLPLKQALATVGSCDSRECYEIVAHHPLQLMWLGTN